MKNDSWMFIVLKKNLLCNKGYQTLALYIGDNLEQSFVKAIKENQI
jgi:hypothetical protein